MVYRVSEIGLKTFVVDLRGHGENSHMLTINTLNDINELTKSLSGYGKVTAIGHPLGAGLLNQSNRCCDWHFTCC
ncbi:alpha/beta hydrolase [Sporolactobacillus shoreicorticis]|uniref:alpha/beta hydrolase n=1 Tax=Sporolactobacillus shoreicorticis TaxID=1923877 RepID=UPI002096C72E|nr:alpha/beta hydrolase [Sporolactobacillus shoreicorticis]MCO7125346.1 alpha/beta hydrolase [Sporolactobacillus shoreicorticis]